jgi:hypothetical protein
MFLELTPVSLFSSRNSRIEVQGCSLCTPKPPIVTVKCDSVSPVAEVWLPTCRIALLLEVPAAHHQLTPPLQRCSVTGYQGTLAPRSHTDVNPVLGSS